MNGWVNFSSLQFQWIISSFLPDSFLVQLKKTDLIEVTTTFDYIDVDIVYEKFREKIQSSESRILPEDLQTFLAGKNIFWIYDDDDDVLTKCLILCFNPLTRKLSTIWNSQQWRQEHSFSWLRLHIFTDSLLLLRVSNQRVVPEELRESWRQTSANCAQVFCESS